jgi:putative transposase
MEVRRTVPVKLDVESGDAALLRETVAEFLWAANYVVDHAWQGEYKTTSKAPYIPHPSVAENQFPFW